MTDETQTSETGAAVAAVDKTIGQVVHEATVAQGEAEGEWHQLADDVKADLEKFGAVIEAVFKHIFNKPIAAPAGNETTAG